jgi:hypothetical protein
MEGVSLLEILIWVLYKEGVSLLEILIWVHYKGRGKFVGDFNMGTL